MIGRTISHYRSDPKMLARLMLARLRSDNFGSDNFGSDNLVVTNPTEQVCTFDFRALI
jgi:hypothetical protein